MEEKARTTLLGFNERSLEMAHDKVKQNHEIKKIKKPKDEDIIPKEIKKETKTPTKV
jgi:hypothetical protein